MRRFARITAIFLGGYILGAVTVLIAIRLRRPPVLLDDADIFAIQRDGRIAFDGNLFDLNELREALKPSQRRWDSVSTCPARAVVVAASAYQQFNGIIPLLRELVRLGYGEYYISVSGKRTIVPLPLPVPVPAIPPKIEFWFEGELNEGPPPEEGSPIPLGFIGSRLDKLKEPCSPIIVCVTSTDTVQMYLDAATLLKSRKLRWYVSIPLRADS